MTIFKRLLAKSSRYPDAPRGAETLPGHTANVMAAAQTLLDETADAQLSAVGLPRPFGRNVFVGPSSLPHSATIWVRRTISFRVW